MDVQLYHAQLYSEAYISWLRACSRKFNGTDNILAFQQKYLVVVAALVGVGEGRPMTVVDIAEYIGMSRSTAQREVCAMITAGVLEYKQEGRRKVVVFGKGYPQKMYADFDKITDDFITALVSARQTYDELIKLTELPNLGN